MVPLKGGAARRGPPTVQEAFKRDPHGGHLYVLRGKSSHLIKIIDGIDWRNPRHTFRPQRAGQPGSIARNYVSI
jgi:hypothetical protein